MSLSIVHTRCAGRECASHYHRGTYQQWFAGLTMVGLPETTVKEARDRVRSAVINSGYEFPAKKITINLAPADLPKEGDDMIYLSQLRFWPLLSSLLPIISIHMSW